VSRCHAQDRETFKAVKACSSGNFDEIGVVSCGNLSASIRFLPVQAAETVSAEDKERVGFDPTAYAQKTFDPDSSVCSLVIFLAYRYIELRAVED